MDEESMAERLRAVERAISEDEVPERIAEQAALSARVDGVEADVADVEERLAELEAAVQALRGYVGNLRTVNRDVERRADSALAKVEQLEGDAPPPEEKRARGERAADGFYRDGPAGHGRQSSTGDDDRRSDGRPRDFAPEHPIPEPQGEERSLRERIAAWL